LSRWVLVDPVGRTLGSPAEAFAEHVGWGITRVGFYSNSKQHAAEIEEAIADAIGAHHSIEKRFYAKPNASVAGTPDLLGLMARETDVVFTGSGD
jgi:hypothetical protein